MRESHSIEQAVGIEYYISDSDGIGGKLRTEPEDFQVQEIENFDPEPVDADPGAYPEILLRATLREWDTNDFAGRISDAMGISRERVAWAGTKDKHAVTTQLFSIRDVDPEAVEAVDINGADIDVLGRTGRSISFGDLHGNRFVIRVRDTDPEAAARTNETTAALRAFVDGDERSSSSSPRQSGDDDQAAGVPNWFGQQRFGSQRPVTHEVGLNIARRQWREAVLSYVANPFETERETTQAARQFVADQAASAEPDWQACLDEIPGYLGFERSMLHRLVEDGADTPEDFRNALEEFVDGGEQSSSSSPRQSGDGDTAGVPNWFGQQRFGSQRPVTHEVGLNIVRGECREAVLSYVANPFETERETTQAARQFVESEAASDDPDWQACLDEIPGYLGFERSMLHRLVEDGADTPADSNYCNELSELASKWISPTDRVLHIYETGPRINFQTDSWTTCAYRCADLNTEYDDVIADVVETPWNIDAAFADGVFDVVILDLPHSAWQTNIRTPYCQNRDGPDVTHVDTAIKRSITDLVKGDGGRVIQVGKTATLMSGADYAYTRSGICVIRHPEKAQDRILVVDEKQHSNLELVSIGEGEVDGEYSHPHGAPNITSKYNRTDHPPSGDSHFCVHCGNHFYHHPAVYADCPDCGARPGDMCRHPDSGDLRHPTAPNHMITAEDVCEGRLKQAIKYHSGNCNGKQRTTLSEANSPRQPCDQPSTQKLESASISEFL